MAFYRKNIGGLHQAVRVLTGIGAAVAAFVFLSGILAWVAAASALAFTATGLLGYCPACAIMGIQRGNGS